jgi:excisionase family DNA binding protein
MSLPLCLTARDRLSSLLAPELVAALEELVSERVASELARLEPSGPEWLTFDQAAERLGCSRDAVRMRVSRGRLAARNHGRRVYVSAVSVASLGQGTYDA